MINLPSRVVTNHHANVFMITEDIKGFVVHLQIYPS